MIDRRSLLKIVASGAAAMVIPSRRAEAALPKAKVTRVKCWEHSSMNRTFNQSALLVTAETDIGITGIGEGGSPDHTMASFSGPVLMEYNYGDRAPEYVAEFVTFRNGKLYPNDRPGLGVTVDFKALKQIAEFDQARTSNAYSRPDGSLTHW
jgi:L-alanine-DL-glutamate epimerase-like enolase superfamily enzyme